MQCVCMCVFEQQTHTHVHAHTHTHTHAEKEREREIWTHKCVINILGCGMCHKDQIYKFTV